MQASLGSWATLGMSQAGVQTDEVDAFAGLKSPEFSVLDGKLVLRSGYIRAAYPSARLGEVPDNVVSAGVTYSSARLLGLELDAQYTLVARRSPDLGGDLSSYTVSKTMDLGHEESWHFPLIPSVSYTQLHDISAMHGPGNITFGLGLGVRRQEEPWGVDLLLRVQKGFEQEDQNYLLLRVSIDIQF